MKNVTNLNVDPSSKIGNGTSAGNTGSSPRGFSSRMLSNSPSRPPVLPLSNDLVFPPGGFPSLRLPTVCSNSISCLYWNFVWMRGSSVTRRPGLKNLCWFQRSQNGFRAVKSFVCLHVTAAGLESRNGSCC